MKNTMLKYWFMLVLLMFAACQEKEELNHVAKGSVSLKASIENSDARTTVDEEGHVSWVVADAIGVFGEETQNAKFQSLSSGSSVLFVGEMSSHQDVPALAYYPYDEHATLDGNTLHFTLPSEYAYTGESKAPMLGIKQADGDFIFKHLCGLLKITVKNMPENAKRLFVVSEGTEEKEAPAIAGGVVVSDVSAEGATLSLEEKGGHEVSIDLENTSAQETYTFYIPVPVGEYPRLSVKLEMNDGGVGFEKNVSNVNMNRALMIDMALIDIVDETISAKKVVVSVEMDNTNGLYVNSFIDEVSLEDNNCSVDVITNGLPQFVFVSENENILMLSRGYFEDDNNVINAESTALALVTMQPAFVLGEKEHFAMLKNKVMQSSNFPLLKSEVEKEIKARKDIFLTENANIPILINKIIEDVYGASSVSRSLKGDIIHCLNNDPEPEPLTIRVDKDKVYIYNKDLYPAYECQVYRGGSLVSPSKVITPTSNYYGILDLLNGENVHWGEPQEFALSERGEYLFFCDMSTEKAILSTAASVVSNLLSLITIGTVKKVEDKENLWEDVYKYSTKSWDNIKSSKDILLKICSDLTFSIGPILLNREMDAKTMFSEILQSFGKYFSQELPTYLAKIEYRKYIVGDNFLMLIEEKKWNGREFMSKMFRFYNVAMAEINVLHRTFAYIECAKKMPFVEFKLCKYNEITCCTKFILDKKESTDNQIGLPYAKLREPLTVGVKTEDGCDVKFDSYQKIKFEVVSGYGIVENQKNENKGAFVISSIDWKLGHSGEQKVKVVVYDEKLNMELSEPVYFTAYFEPEEAEGIITTGEATNITQTTATLSGNIQGYGADDFQHRYGFIYSTDATPSASNGTIVYSDNILEDGNYSVDVASLTQNTTYYYRAFVIDGGNYVYGDVKSFTTLNEMSERDILIAFYNATDGDNWTNNTNWCSDYPLGSWYGVETDANGKVIELRLHNSNENEKFGLKGYANLSGMKHLESIKLAGNVLTSIDVSGCVALKVLDCYYNQLTNLNVSDCFVLERLSCTSNMLTSLNISDCTSLKQLFCPNNQLTSLNLIGLTRLEQLSCYNNSLSLLELSNCTSLKELNCSDSQLSSLDVSNCTALNTLQCSRNKLTSLDVSNCTVLRFLECGLNQLTSLEVSGLTKLEHLNCDYNELISLDISDCTFLKSLRCSINQLTSLDLFGHAVLEELYCSHNKLVALDISNCTSLTFLDCTYNQLTSLNASDCVSLGNIYCSDNQLVSLNLSGCNALFKLNCSNNRLSSLDLSSSTSLKDLNCQKNQLTSLDMSDFSMLEYLYCYNNQLVSLDVSGCTSLKSLSCSKNKIVSVIPDWFSQLSFSYDQRYSYKKVYENGQEFIKYEDNGVGWWYPGEPDRGYHKE